MTCTATSSVSRLTCPVGLSGKRTLEEELLEELVMELLEERSASFAREGKHLPGMNRYKY